MPEGPEVASITSELRKLMVGKTIVTVGMVQWKNGRFLKGVEVALERVAFPLRVDYIGCKGKQILFRFSEIIGDSPVKWYGLSSLGMTGFWAITEESHAHIDFGFDDGTHVYYCDSRRFGNFTLTDDECQFQTILADLAPSFTGDEEYRITLDVFAARTRACKQKFLVVALMDQHCICSSIGNYLLSELMYATRLHPDIRCSDLTSAQIESLYANAVDLTERSCTAGGMSMSDYRKPDGSQGSFINQLAVYNKSVTPDGHVVTSSKGRHGRKIHWDPLAV